MTLRERILSIPPYVPVVAWVAYVGWAALFSGGVSPAHGVLPMWLRLLWTAAFAFGSTVAVAGALTDRTRLESSGLGTLLSGLVFFGFVVASVDPHPGATLASVVAFVLMCLLRMRVLAVSRRASRTARRIQRRNRQ